MQVRPVERMKSPAATRVAVIGAGPSGLVTLKHLITAHEFLGVNLVEAVLFEAEDAVGGTFAHRTYEDAEVCDSTTFTCYKMALIGILTNARVSQQLVSSKQLTTFSDFRPRPDDPDFLSTGRYVEYLNDYCTHFKLWDHIKLGSAVVSVRRRNGPKGGHIISYRSKKSTSPVSSSAPAANEPLLEYDCDAIAICSGLHVTPNVPAIKGIENVPSVLHSADFKTKAQLGVRKTVLILGSGETGTDLGYIAVNSPTKRVLLSHRDGFMCPPKGCSSRFVKCDGL